MDSELLLFISIGFVAQLVDGALGMAFGILCSSGLLALGLPPALASASVHAAETATTAMSGLSHFYNRNLDKRLFLKLVVPGVLGGIFGAYLLTGLPERAVRIFVAFYLVAMAALIFGRALGHIQRKRHLPPQLLGVGGGFLDAIGGGGWGPLVASALLATGNEPRRSIGTVNCAEFFVTVAISVTFLLHLDISRYGHVVLGLIIGGGMAAPLAGYLLRIMPQKLALSLVGVVVSGQAVVTVYHLVTR